MTIARLKGKISEGEPDWLEDLLTSDVLGALRYLPVDVGVGAVLDLASDDRGRTFVDWRASLGVEWSGAVSRIAFWPRLQTREPDALVRVWTDGAPEPALGVLLEAKFHSDQHEIDGLSQLGWYAWRHIDDAWVEVDESASIAGRAVVFVTKHRDLPAAEIVGARREAAGKLGVAPDDVPVFWIGWRAITALVSTTWEARRGDAAGAPWLRHLLDMREHLRARDLGAEQFERIGTPPGRGARLEWRGLVPPARVPARVVGAAIRPPPPVLPLTLGARDDQHR